MKRLIIILTIFFAVIGVAIFETVHLNRFYKDFIGHLEYVRVQFEIDPENVDREECIEAVEKVRTHWEGGRRVTLMFTNNNVVRLLGERVSSLVEQTRINHADDAFVTLAITIDFIRELRRENGVNVESLI